MSDDFDKDMPWLDDDSDGSDDADESGLDLDWLKDDDVELSDLPQTGDLSLELDWMNEDDESSSSPGEPRSGVTGELSWMRSAGDDDSLASFGDDDDVPEVDWGTGGDETDDSQIGSRSTGVTGELSWIDDTEEEFEEQLDAAEEAAAETADSFLDMDDDAPADDFDDSLPEWLRGAAMDFDDEEDEIESPVIDEPPPEPEISALSTAELESIELPEWLQSPDDGLPDDQMAAPDSPGSWSPPADEAEQSAAFVDDMAAFDPESPLEPTGSDLPATGDLPDWLGDDTGAASSPAFDVRDENPISDGDDDTFISATMPQTGDLPDWLTADDDEAQAEAPAFADESDAFDPDAAALPQTGDLPDWLTADDDEAQAEAPAFADESDAFDPNAAALPQTGDLPDWLTSDDSGDTSEQEVPDWMTGLNPEEASAETVAFSADDLISDNMPQTGELTWMQDLDAGDAEEEEESADAESFDQFDADEAFEEFEDDDLAFEGDEYEEDFDEEDLELEAMFGADLDDSVGEDELDALLEDADASDLVPGFDDMFSDEAFDVANDDEFDLLGEMTAEGTGLTGMLGGDSDDAFDLLNELDDGDDVDFDLLGELAGDDAQGEPDQETPIADMVADDDAFLEEAQTFAATIEPDDSPDSDDLGGLLDDELLLAELDDDGLLADLDTGDLDGLLDEVEVEEQEEAFRWFDEGDQQAAMPDIDSEDMDWLQDIRPDDLREPDAAAVDDLLDEPMAMFDEPPKFGNVDEYIASLDEENFTLPTTGELQDSGLGVDFDALLDDETLSALDYETGLDASTRPELAPDAPEWLSDLSQQAGDANSAAAIVRRRQDRPVEELDDRLRDLRERGLNLKTDDITEDSEILEQVLPGVKNTLPAISQQHIVQPTTVTQIALEPDQVAQAMLLKELSGQRDEGEVAESSRVRRILTDRVVIGVLLLLVMIVPFFVSDINIGDLPPNTFAAGSHQMAFFDAVDDLSPGDQVLIAVEFGSAGAAELDDSTEALLRHTLARGAVPVIVSSNPIGLLRIDTRMRDIAEENALTASVDYVVGTYLVADVVGLRNFAENIDLYVSTDARGEPTGIDIDSLDVFSLIVVVSETSERVRAWGEQIAPIADAPLVAVTGAGAMPLSEPYLAANSDLISGYLVGYGDGYTYRAMLNRLLTGGTIDIPPTETPPPPTVEPTAVPADGAGTDAETTEESSEIELTAAIVITETPTNTPAVTETPAATETPAISPTPTMTNTPAPTDTPVPTNTPTFTPTPTPEPIRVITVATDGAVNIRPDASTSNPPVGVIQAGGEALVIAEQENDIGELWYNIRFFDISGNVVDGWIRSDLVDIATVDDLPDGLPEPDPADSDESAKQAIFSKQAAPPRLMQDDPTPLPAPEDINATLTAASDVLETVQPDEIGGTLTAAAETLTAIAPEDISVTLTAAAEIVPDEMANTLTAAPMTLTAVAETAESALDSVPTVQVTPDASQEQQEGIAAPEAATIAAEEPEQVNTADLPRQIAPMDDEFRDERWYSMTLGIAFAVIVIAMGNLFNVVRAARRRRND